MYSAAQLDVEPTAVFVVVAARAGDASRAAKERMVAFIVFIGVCVCVYVGVLKMRESWRESSWDAKVQRIEVICS